MKNIKKSWEQIKYEIKYENPFIRLRNFLLSRRYPWLKPYNVWSGELDPKWKYKYLLIEPNTDGWMKLYFYPLMEEIRKRLKKYNYIKEYRIDQYKEKFGEMRLYDGGSPKESGINDLINEYTVLSRNICLSCGRPDVGFTRGWIYPICKKCYEKTDMHKDQPYEEAINPKYTKMEDYHCYTRYSNDIKEKHEDDIRPLANMLRKRWNRKHPFDKVELVNEQD